MILKGSQRSGAGELAQHLLKEENDHVSVKELRGFIANDLTGALREVQAIAKGTKCTQYLFSLSLNPPPDRIASEQDLLDAADMAEARLGLTGQPRAIVFHEKQGRRHAHVVWSRIDADNMRAINLPHYKVKLTALSKELYLSHGWELPKGLEDRSLRDPLNFTREEWQQALRAGRDVRELKQLFQSAWAQTDNAQSLAACLQQKGFLLAKGDRRGVVAVDYLGEVYALARYAGVKSKDMKGRFSDLHALPSVEQVKDRFREGISPRLDLMKDNQTSLHDRMRASHNAKIKELAKVQRAERQALDDALLKRAFSERDTRQRRMNDEIGKGLKAVWSHLTGRAAKLRQDAEWAVWQALQRDQRERDALIYEQLKTRQKLSREAERLKAFIRADKHQLDHEMAAILRMDRADRRVDVLSVERPERINAISRSVLARGMDHSP